MDSIAIFLRRRSGLRTIARRKAEPVVFSDSFGVFRLAIVRRRILPVLSHFGWLFSPRSKQMQLGESSSASTGLTEGNLLLKRASFTPVGSESVAPAVRYLSSKVQSQNALQVE